MQMGTNVDRKLGLPTHQVNELSALSRELMEELYDVIEVFDLSCADRNNPPIINSSAHCTL
jgi:hypothetical protein